MTNEEKMVYMRVALRFYAREQNWKTPSTGLGAAFSP